MCKSCFRVTNLLCCKKNTSSELFKLPQNTGCESLSFSFLAFSLQTSLLLTNYISRDSKVDIIRVTNNYRLIGKYKDGIFYIMAYDIDFSTYNHG